VATPIEVLVPDIGGFKDVSVIDVLVKDGQQIEKETPLITIETEKAAMDVPAPAAGRIAQVKLKQGDKVSEGSVILLIEPTVAAAAAQAALAGNRAGPGLGGIGIGAGGDRAGRSRSGACRGARRCCHRRTGILARLCQSFGAQICARAGRRFGPHQGHRRQGPHHAG
jgi:dihydrolipoamide dehydrogenase